MAELVSDFAPYAPAKPVLEVIGRFRERGLPDPLTTTELERIGVPASMAPRTLQALRFLRLVDEEGHRLEAMDQLKRAPTPEYPGTLAGVLREAYAPVFQIVDPSTDDDTAVADAFRHFQPSAQRDKMVRLFRGLCAEAGIISQEAVRQRTAPNARRSPIAATSGRCRSRAAARPAEPRVIEPAGPAAPTGAEDGLADYRLVNAVLHQLPRDGRWSKERRDRWLQAMTAAVDLVVEMDE